MSKIRDEAETVLSGVVCYDSANRDKRNAKRVLILLDAIEEHIKDQLELYGMRCSELRWAIKQAEEL